MDRVQQHALCAQPPSVIGMAGAKKYVCMVIPVVTIDRWLVNRAVRRNAEAICDRHGKGVREPGAIARRQFHGQGDDHLPGNHCIAALMVVFDGIPECSAIGEFRTARQQQTGTDDTGAAVVVMFDARAVVEDGYAGAVGRCCSGAATVSSFDRRLGAQVIDSHSKSPFMGYWGSAPIARIDEVDTLSAPLVKDGQNKGWLTWTFEPQCATGSIYWNQRQGWSK